MRWGPDHFCMIQLIRIIATVTRRGRLDRKYQVQYRAQVLTQFEAEALSVFLLCPSVSFWMSAAATITRDYAETYFSGDWRLNLLCTTASEVFILARNQHLHCSWGGGEVLERLARPLPQRKANVRTGFGLWIFFINIQTNLLCFLHFIENKWICKPFIFCRTENSQLTNSPCMYIFL